MAPANHSLTLKAEVLSWGSYTFFMERQCLQVLLADLVNVSISITIAHILGFELTSLPEVLWTRVIIVN